MREGITFDDVLIVPAYSEIASRSDISLRQEFLGLELELPVISANMDYVTGGVMANAMRQNGALGILHRFHDDFPLGLMNDIETITHEEHTIIEASQATIAFSIGTRDIDKSIWAVGALLSSYSYFNPNWIICIDVAHGAHSKVVELIKAIKKSPSNPYVIAGNIATRNGFWRLAQAGADAVKIGIGPGSVCTTREVTGVGVPQLTAIMEAASARNGAYSHVKLIADGGIKNSGDIVKALAAGADTVMLGSLLAGSPECPGEVRVGPDNSRWRPYRGQSIFGVNGDKFVPEGISGWVKEKPPVSETLAKIAGGIRSGMSYIGARNLTELRENVEFIKISQSTHIESGTRVSPSIG